MALTPGTRLGHYEILEPIGKGGMGEVYRARDTRLGREVAVKVSATQFSERFEREARVIASLNHPNICTLHDVGPNYLVMELIEGESPQGPMPLEAAMKIAQQIADALDAAHEKGIVHRDLKPGNIKIKPDGTVKVLDFGLAKVGLGTTQSSADPAQSPTISMGATQAGMILGTAAYMAPEQARGSVVDKRADIWAFGVVLYELMTGKRLFQGSTVSDTLASVLKDEPDWSIVPVQARTLLKSCLRRDPKLRLHDIADAKLLMDVAPEAAAPSAPKSSLPWKVAAGLLFAAVGLTAWAPWRAKPAAPEVTRFQLAPPEKNSFGIYLVLAPNGRRLAFTASGADGRLHLWVRDFDSLDARMLPGTEITSGFGSPFWSPDSKYIAFADSNKLMKVEASGASPAQTLCEVQGSPGSGTWSPEGVIVFGGRGTGPLRRVAAGGGSATAVTVVDPARGEGFHAFPYFLPDGKHFVYLRTGSPQVQGIYVGSLDAKPEEQPKERLIPSTFNAIYAPSGDASMGRLLFLREGTLMAAPFNPGSLTLAGDAFPVAEQIGSSNVYGFYSVSVNGALSYRGGAQTGDRQLTWFDRQGKLIGAAGTPAPYGGVSLSPDTMRSAGAMTQNNNQDVWVTEFAKGTNARFTFDPSIDGSPVWSPDGSQIAFLSRRPAGAGIWVKPSNGAGEEQLLFQTPEEKFPRSWSTDGRFLLFQMYNAKTQYDLWFLPMTGDRKPVQWLATQFDEDQGRFSPDSRWIAYRSDESGRTEIYVRPFSPDQSASGKWMISNGGGNSPSWRRDGKELIYRAPDGGIMSVDITTAPSFQASVPKRLFLPVAPAAPGDVTPDAQRFLFALSSGENSPSPITVVMNWETALKK